MSWLPPIPPKVVFSGSSKASTATTTTTAAAATPNDVFARGPPQPPPPPRVPPPSSTSNEFHMELPSTRSSTTPSGNSNTITAGDSSTNQQVPKPNDVNTPQPPQLQQQQQQQPSTASVETSTGTAFPSNSIPKFMIDSTKSLDELANEFLAVVSTTSDSTPPSSSSSSIASNTNPSSDYERLHRLMEQRSYMDVILHTRNLLEGSSSHYTYLFDAIKNISTVSSVGNDISNSTSNSGNTNEQQQRLQQQQQQQYQQYVTTIELALDTHKQELVQIMSIHIVAMLKLQLFKELNNEIDHQWLFCYHHRLTDTLEQKQRHLPKLLSWIPWKFHILAATTIQYGSNNDSNQQCLDALYTIREEILMTANPTSNSINNCNSNDIRSIMEIDVAIQNICIKNKNYRLAIQSIQNIINHIPNIINDEVNLIMNINSIPTAKSDEVTIRDNIQQLVMVLYHAVYLSQQGRILLQMGAIHAAQCIFHSVHVLYKDINHLNDSSSSTTNLRTPNIQTMLLRIIKAQVSSNSGLIFFSDSKYEEALESFNTVIQEIKSFDDGIISSDDKNSSKSPILFESIRHDLYIETMNNISVCALYTCRIYDAIQVLENCIRISCNNNSNNQYRYCITERIVMNLCTMYELVMDTSMANTKKSMIQYLITTRCLIQDIPSDCFRLS